MENPNKTLKQLFQGNTYKLLKGRAQDLTVGDCWRIGGFKPPNLPFPQDDPKLQLSQPEMDSLSLAWEQHIKDNGVNDGWQYVGYSCFTCHVCGICCG